MGRKAVTRGHSIQKELSLPSSERRLLLRVLDLLAVNGALLPALALRPGYGLEGALVIRHSLWFLVLSGLWMLVAQAFDAYDLRVAGRFSSSALAVLKAGLVTCGGYLLIPYITPYLPSSRSMLLSFPLITIGALVVAQLSSANPLLVMGGMGGVSLPFTCSAPLTMTWTSMTIFSLVNTPDLTE